MKTGWLKDGEEWYYFHEDGILAVDEWIDDSYVNADGIWVPEAVK
jgi:glucan-binding YG repeat protein